MFAVFPLIVQNSVPVRQIGSAVSNLSFFQQVGGTVGPGDHRHGLRDDADARSCRRRSGRPAAAGGRRALAAGAKAAARST